MSPAERSTRAGWAALLPVVLLASAIAGCERPEAEIPPQQAAVRSVEGVDETVLASMPSETVDMMEQGRQHYVICSVCHGFDGSGTQLGPSLLGPEWIHISGELEEIENIVRTGVRNPTTYPIPMPEMGGGDFDATELRALATYVHALSSGRR